MLRWLSPLAVLLAVLATTRAAKADPPLVRATLVYTVGDDARGVCPAESALREQVALRLGYDPFAEKGDRAVAVTITRRPKKKGFHAAIAITSPDGTSAARDLDDDGDRCEELARSVVLAVSLAIDPLHVAHPAAPTTPPPDASDDGAAASAAPLPSEQSPAAPPPPPAGASAPPPTWTTEIAAGARLGLGVVPSASLGPVVDVRFDRARWSLLVEAGADLPTGHVTGPRGAGSITATLLRGGFGACATPLVFLLCARADLGALEGKGEGFATETGTSFYADVATSAGVSIPLSENLRIGASAEIVVPLARTTLYLDNLPGWTTPSVAAAFALSLGYRF